MFLELSYGEFLLFYASSIHDFFLLLKDFLSGNTCQSLSFLFKVKTSLTSCKLLKWEPVEDRNYDREKRSQHWYKSVWKLLWYLVVIYLSWLFFISQVVHFLRIDYWYLGELDDKWMIPPSVPLPQHPIQKKKKRIPFLVPVVEYLEFSCWAFTLNLLLKKKIVIILSYVKLLGEVLIDSRRKTKNVPGIRRNHINSSPTRYAGQ